MALQFVYSAVVPHDTWTKLPSLLQNWLPPLEQHLPGLYDVHGQRNNQGEPGVNLRGLLDVQIQTVRPKGAWNSSRITTMTTSVIYPCSRDHQIDTTASIVYEPFPIPLCECLYSEMHGLFFETSVWPLAKARHEMSWIMKPSNPFSTSFQYSALASSASWNKMG